jgi:hypothetical protein
MIRLVYVNDYSEESYGEVISLCLKMQQQLASHLKEPLEINFTEDDVGRKLIVIKPSFKKEGYDINQLNNIKRRLRNYKVNLIIETAS